MTQSSTNSTPEVTFRTENVENKKTAFLILKGKSLPEYATKFYDPIADLVESSNHDKLCIEINLEYMNSSSDKCIYNLIKRCLEHCPDTKITWVSDEDDEEMQESGQILSEALDHRFVFIQNTLG